MAGDFRVLCHHELGTCGATPPRHSARLANLGPVDDRAARAPRMGGRHLLASRNDDTAV